RLGLCVVNGLRQEHGEQIEREREHRRFESLDDFKRRVSLAKHEFRALAELGALNCFVEHRRAAMWRVEETVHDDLLGSATPGSTGCQPVVCGSLPQTSLHPNRLNTFHSVGQPAERDRLAACAPRKRESPLAPMTLPERVKA